MVRSSSGRPAKQRQTEAGSYVAGRGEHIQDFLERELPPGNTKQAPYLATTLLEAGERYDRYYARRSEWEKYATRRRRLQRILNTIKQLAHYLCDLDVLSRDDLEGRTAPKQIETLVGSLQLLHKETQDLLKQIQTTGRPRNLAEERWIMELADIYENAFGRAARVSGSGGDTVERRGKFYNLLEVSRPLSFPRHGKLSLRQIERTLKARSRRLGVALMV